MKVTVSLTPYVWFSIGVLFLLKANATDMWAKKSCSTEDPSHETGHKNLSLTILINSSVSLNCSFDGNLEKSILWWFNYYILFSGNKLFPIVRNVRVEVDADSSFLYIDRFQPSNAGSYLCRRGKNETGLLAYLYIRRQITKLSLIFVNESLTNPIKVAVNVENDESYTFGCFGDEPPCSPFIWKIDGKSVSSIHSALFDPGRYSDVDDAKYFGS